MRINVKRQQCVRQKKVDYDQQTSRLNLVSTKEFFSLIKILILPSLYFLVWAKGRRYKEGVCHTDIKNQLPSLSSTQLVFFDTINIQQSCGPSTTSHLNKYNISFPEDKEGKVDVENCVYDMKNKK